MARWTARGSIGPRSASWRTTRCLTRTSLSRPVSGSRARRIGRSAGSSATTRLSPRRAQERPSRGAERAGSAGSAGKNDAGPRDCRAAPHLVGSAFGNRSTISRLRSLVQLLDRVDEVVAKAALDEVGVRLAVDQEAVACRHGRGLREEREALPVVLTAEREDRGRAATPIIDTGEDAVLAG